MTRQMLEQLVFSAIGAAAFGVLFRVYGRKLAFAAAGGACCWGVYLAATVNGVSRPTAFLIAALATAALAELLARLMKTPVLTLLVPMLIPLVPGGDLYYTTLALVQSNMTDFAHYGGMTLREAGGISLGVILVACTVQAIYQAMSILDRKK